MNRASELTILANLQVERGEYFSAIEYLRRALQIQERALGRNNLALAPIIHELALVHAAADHDGEARNLLARLLSILPQDHPLVKEVDLTVIELNQALTAA